MRAFGSPVSNPVERSGDRLGAAGIIGQNAVVDFLANVTVPAGANFCFGEVVGGGGSSSNGGRGGGGAGADALFPVVPGETLIVAHTTTSATLTEIPSTIKRGSTTLVSAARGAGGSSGGPGAGGAGKYPGSPAGTSTPGIGGGRLAAKLFDTNYQVPSVGMGQAFSGKGGAGYALLTFFVTYDEALAFAKAVYGGSWVP